MLGDIIFIRHSCFVQHILHLVVLFICKLNCDTIETCYLADNLINRGGYLFPLSALNVHLCGLCSVKGDMTCAELPS